MSKVFSFQVPDNMYDVLEKISKEEHRSKGYIVRELVEEYIKDYADIKYAKAVSKEIEDGKVQLISWEEIKKKYGLES
jgi:predicted DNA-binding protein